MFRTEVKQAVDQPHEEWRPNIDAIKVEYDEELIEPEIGEIDYDNSIAAPKKKSGNYMQIDKGFYSNKFR